MIFTPIWERQDQGMPTVPVSYTHLDVYKRQPETRLLPFFPVYLSLRPSIYEPLHHMIGYEAT